MKKYTNDEIEKIYLDLISPMNFRGNFKNKRAFIEWLEFRTIKDLECTLEKFIQAEMYEDCCLIRDMIKRKKLKKLTK